ncbi:SipW-dependent-type signal peptide-containing protein [Halorientalis marina]|uniref:SipW-dependent-type signal peptide-containing protein n=1 Tax=Halorientalis marina TaxID=2931976 RepID=UPI001FF44490|nr:SipW-dependent-type signal peptide-containing protein [Halorientalis marina]
MSDDGLNMSRRKVLGGITTVGAASAAAGAGTFALFSDTSRTNEKTISTGTVSFQDGNPTELNISADKAGASGEIEGSTKFTYDGSIDGAAFVVGMDVNGTDNSNNLAKAINLDAGYDENSNVATGITITKVNDSGSEEKYSDVVDFDGEQTLQGRQENLYVDQETITLNELANNVLTGNETIQPEDSDSADSDVTDDVSALRYYEGLSSGESVTVSIQGSWSDLSNDYQGKEIGVTVYGKVVEPSSN